MRRLFGIRHQGDPKKKKKAMKKYVFLLMILMQFSCTEKTLSNYEKLKSDSLISQSFTDVEIQDLAKMLDFIESEICIDSEHRSTKECYEILLKKDSIKVANEEVLRVLNYEKQSTLYGELDQHLFYNLWDISSQKLYKQIEGQEYEYEHLSYYLKTYDSKYMEFLKRFANENKDVKKYLDEALVSGEFNTPSITAFMSIDYRKFDFSDIKIQLVYAFYYLDINETRINPWDEMNKSLNLK